MELIKLEWKCEGVITIKEKPWYGKAVSKDIVHDFGDYWRYANGSYSLPLGYKETILTFIKTGKDFLIIN